MTRTPQAVQSTELSAAVSPPPPDGLGGDCRSGAFDFSHNAEVGVGLITGDGCGSGPDPGHVPNGLHELEDEPELESGEYEHHEDGQHKG